MAGQDLYLIGTPFFKRAVLNLGTNRDGSPKYEHFLFSIAYQLGSLLSLLRVLPTRIFTSRAPRCSASLFCNPGLHTLKSPRAVELWFSKWDRRHLTGGRRFYHRTEYLTISTDIDCQFYLHDILSIVVVVHCNCVILFRCIDSIKSLSINLELISFGSPSFSFYSSFSFLHSLNRLTQHSGRTTESF